MQVFGMLKVPFGKCEGHREARVAAVMFHTDTMHEVRASGHNCTRGMKPGSITYWTRIQAANYGMAPRNFHKEGEIEECAISRENHGYLCHCYELLASSFGRQPARTAIAQMTTHCRGTILPSGKCTVLFVQRRPYWRMTAFRCGVVKLSDCVTCCNL